MNLKHPIKFGKLEVTKLVFKDQPTAEDLLAFDERGAVKQTIALIASLTNNDVEIIKKLHVEDYRAADKIAFELVNPENDEKN